MSANEAAERLRFWWTNLRKDDPEAADDYDLALREALAAERRAMLSLLAGPDDRVTGADYKRAAQTLADYRAEERRATVERLREAALEKRKQWGAEGLPASLAAILDEEAAR